VDSLSTQTSAHMPGLSIKRNHLAKPTFDYCGKLKILEKFSRVTFLVTAIMRLGWREFHHVLMFFAGVIQNIPSGVLRVPLNRISECGQGPTYILSKSHELCRVYTHSRQYGTHVFAEISYAKLGEHSNIRPPFKKFLNIEDDSNVDIFRSETPDELFSRNSYRTIDSK